MKKRVNNQLPNNLLQLQNLVKRDPESYKDEFYQQLQHYKAYMQIFQQNSSEYVQNLDETVYFLSQVAHCYPEDLKDFPQELMDVLKSHHTTLHPEMRLKLCRALILLRNKNLLQPTTLLELFFNLLQCQDKILRKFLQSHITADIKNTNSKHKNVRLNSTLQNFMYTMLETNNVRSAKMALDIMVDLYHKQVWNDNKTVNVIVLACFSPITKIMVTAIKFFLGKDEEEEKKDEDDDSSEDDMPSANDLMKANLVNKKSRKRKKQLKKVKKVVIKHKKKKKSKDKAPIFNFSALHLVNDPQTMAEKLFKQLQGRNERFEVKLMTMNLISRLIGVHQLFVLNFYPFLQRFLQPHQREVTKVLQYTAQASHELVPPDILESVLKTIANNFITERNSAEVMTVGLNTIRELCTRCPYVMPEDLLSDLALYKSYKDKNVVMAARSLIQLYRNVNPELLGRKHRGKPSEATTEIKAKQYGEIDSKDYVSGADALEETPEIGDENDEESESEVEDSDGDGWVNVSHDSDVESGEEKEDDGVTVEEKIKKAIAVSQNRILSQDDFKKIRIAQLRKQIEPPGKNKGKKRSLEIDEDEEIGNGEFVSLSAIERLHKRPKNDKESRLATVMEGREGREKFGSRRKKKNPMASISNKGKRKTKAFMMVKHKFKRKVKRSFHDKQIALRNSLLKKKMR